MSTDQAGGKHDIAAIVAKWKDKRGSLIMALHEIQNHFGYVPREVSLQLSELMDVPLARIYEVVTFYSYFKLQPPGKHKVAVCLGTACYLKGAPGLVSELKEQLGVGGGQTTADGLFHVEPVRCLGCCGLAPVVAIDGKVYGKVKRQEIAAILSEYEKR